MALIEKLSQASWHPVPPPRRGRPASPEFHVSILIPGFANAYHQTVLGRCYSTISDYRAKARVAIEQDPHLKLAIKDAMGKITLADGMKMARLRGHCQLPYWSRLAIVDYKKQGFTIPDIASAFNCSLRTVVNVVNKTNFLYSDRVLTKYQLNPPAKKMKNMVH